MRDDTAVIAVNGLSKVFRGDRRTPRFTAVDGISFTVPRGEIFGCIGPNGAGKTTTIRILLGLMRPTAGTVEVLGLDMPRAAKALHARTGYMSQRFTFYDELTAGENLRFYGRAYGLTGRSRLGEVVDLLGLSGVQKELARNLPGGWRQRLALGCAIIHDPELIFLDEPTAGVDPVARRELWELFYTLAGSGKTIFVTTHVMDEAELCQRLAFMAAGRIAVIGKPEALKQASQVGEALEIDCAEPERALAVLTAARAAGRIDTVQIALHGDILRLVLAPAAHPGTSARIAQSLAGSGIAVRSLQAAPPTIEDVFIATTAARQPA